MVDAGIEFITPHQRIAVVAGIGGWLVIRVAGRKGGQGQKDVKRIFHHTLFVFLLLPDGVRSQKYRDYQIIIGENRG